MDGGLVLAQLVIFCAQLRDLLVGQIKAAAQRFLAGAGAGSPARCPAGSSVALQLIDLLAQPGLGIDPRSRHPGLDGQARDCHGCSVTADGRQRCLCSLQGLLVAGAGVLGEPSGPVS